MRIVICGSMSASKQMVDIADSLNKKGHMTVLPENIRAHMESLQQEQAKEKEELDVFKVYFRQINDSDAILVVNEEKNGEKNYIGPNTLIEMSFAHILGKKIYILNMIPDSHAHDEIIAMHPIELCGSLEKLL